MVMESLVPSPTLIFNLVREITNAIKIAGENTKECDEIRGRVEIVGMYVEEVKANPAVLQNERMKKALSHTEDVLRHALKTITNQEKANAAKRYYNATDYARHLTLLKEKIKYWSDEVRNANKDYNKRHQGQRANSSRPHQHKGPPHAQVINTLTNLKHLLFISSTYQSTVYIFPITRNNLACT